MRYLNMNMFTFTFTRETMCAPQSKGGGNSIYEIPVIFKSTEGEEEADLIKRRNPVNNFLRSQ